MTKVTVFTCCDFLRTSSSKEWNLQAVIMCSIAFYFESPIFSKFSIHLSGISWVPTVCQAPSRMLHWVNTGALRGKTVMQVMVRCKYGFEPRSRQDCSLALYPREPRASPSPFWDDTPRLPSGALTCIKWGMESTYNFWSSHNQSYYCYYQSTEHRAWHQLIVCPLSLLLAFCNHADMNVLSWFPTWY